MAESAPKIVRRKSTTRSKVGNGSHLALGDAADGRSQLARRLKEHIADISADLGREPSPGEAVVIRRVATMAVQAELDDARLLAGEAVDPDRYNRRALIVTSLVKSLGLLRRNKGEIKFIDSHAELIRGGRP